MFLVYSVEQLPTKMVFSTQIGPSPITALTLIDSFIYLGQKNGQAASVLINEIGNFVVNPSNISGHPNITSISGS